MARRDDARPSATGSPRRGPLLPSYIQRVLGKVSHRAYIYITAIRADKKLAALYYTSGAAPDAHVSGAHDNGGATFSTSWHDDLRPTSGRLPVIPPLRVCSVCAYLCVALLVMRAERSGGAPRGKWAPRAKGVDSRANCPDSAVYMCACVPVCARQHECIYMLFRARPTNFTVNYALLLLEGWAQDATDALKLVLHALDDVSLVSEKR